MTFSIKPGWALAALAFLTCTGALQANTASEPVSDNGVTPYIIPGANPGGNRTCAEVGSAFYGNATYYQCWSAKRNYPGEFGLGFDDISGNPGCPQDIQVTVTDGTYVSFTAVPHGIGAALIKGSSNTNVYVYSPQVISDSGLAAPPNPNGSPAGLSNIGGFCWNPSTDPGPGTCYEDETAWSAGDRYRRRGNWATYTEYEEDLVVTLWAGQHHDAGDVMFSAANGNTITISILLNTGWRFALSPVGEENGMPIFDNNVKIQDYNNAPGGNPAPGQFEWKSMHEGDFAEVVVPLNNFYGVHIDVEREVDCPDQG